VIGRLSLTTRITAPTVTSDKNGVVLPNTLDASEAIENFTLIRRIISCPVTQPKRRQTIFIPGFFLIAFRSLDFKGTFGEILAISRTRLPPGA
jgi:hypothetical protein